jgi:hypothetical protein
MKTHSLRCSETLRTRSVLLRRVSRALSSAQHHQLYRFGLFLDLSWTFRDFPGFICLPLHCIFANLPRAHYDSLLVKCTCHGSTYEIARRKMIRALVEFRIRGVKTNIPFLASLLTHPTFIDGNCWTTFIDDTPELFDLVGSQNRGQKLLAYLGDVAVNGKFNFLAFFPPTLH